MKIRNLIIVMFSIILTSCASKKPEGKTEAEVLYKESKQLIEDGRYILATEKINLLKNKYPYSYYATPAELLEADILFQQENYVEAAAAYMLFRDFHPRHEKLPFVVYRIAESYYKQIPDTYDRDLQAADEAIKYYNELLERYPATEYVKDASNKIKYCKEMLRSKEQYIADFYFKTEKFSAARWRYLDILSNNKNSSLRKHSMVRVVESSLKLKDFQKCISYADQYITNLGGKEKSQVNEARNRCQSKLK